MINMPSTESLQPHIAWAGGRKVPVFSGNTLMVKLDLLFNAGTACQPQLLCAGAANKLVTVATSTMDAAAMAEFMDFRGVMVEPAISTTQSTLAFYFLRRHAEELLPVIADMLCRPAFAESDFHVWQGKRRQELATIEQRTSHIARKIFYGELFGLDHPLGRYAMTDDADRLMLDNVKGFWRQHYGLKQCDVVLAGCVDDDLVALVGTCFGAETDIVEPMGLPTPEPKEHNRRLVRQMDGATQTSLRIGRVIPLRWDDPDYARLMLLVTALGGYFGSRLMQNIREDKGYTYGINARSQIFRGLIVFYITADVAAGTADVAVKETFNELRRLREEPIGEEELQLVKTVLTGDYLRSVDGVFELSTRYCDMLGTGVDERLTDNIREAIKETTAVQLQELAQRLFGEEDMIVCLAGV